MLPSEIMVSFDVYMTSLLVVVGWVGGLGTRGGICIASWSVAGHAGRTGWVPAPSITSSISIRRTSVSMVIIVSMVITILERFGLVGSVRLAATTSWIFSAFNTVSCNEKHNFHSFLSTRTIQIDTM